MDLLSNCLLMASDRRPAGRKVAPLPRTFVKHFSTKFNFVCNAGGSIQKFKDVSRRTGRSLTCQCHWNCRQMRCFNWRLITTKTLGAWCLSAGFISRKDVKQHLLDPCGCLSTSGNSLPVPPSDAGAEHDVRKLQNDSSRSTVTRNVWEV